MADRAGTGALSLWDAVHLRGRTPKAFGRYATKVSLLPFVRARRRRLRATTFVGVTGSAGKSTAKELIAAVLETAGEVKASYQGGNRVKKVSRTILATRRRHRFCVQELGAFGPETLDELLWVFEPDAAVVTNVGWDHLKEFRGQDAVAEEKVKLVAAIPPTGVAILSWDDPRVRAMAARSRGRVLSYGLSRDADVRAEGVRAEWPERLSFTLRHDGAAYPVRTRLIGAHWTTAVLAAVATGIALGVPVADAVAAISKEEPIPHRLSLLELPSGPTFLLDDWKAAVWTIAPALDVLAGARGRRRVAVIGQLADDPRRPRKLYAEIALEARERADLVVLVGQWAHHGLRARVNDGDDSIRAFETVEKAAAHLREELRPRDVVLIKGTHGDDHLERVVLAQALRVDCWRVVCDKKIFCERCRRLTSEPREHVQSSWRGQRLG